MNSILVRIPSFCIGNIGDKALIVTIKNIFKNYNLIIPKKVKKN